MARFVSGLYARNGAFWLFPWAGDTFLYSPLREIKLHARAVDGLRWKKPGFCGCCWISLSGISEQPWRKYICEANSSLWREKFGAKLLRERVASIVNCKALQGTTWCMVLDLLCTKIYVLENRHWDTRWSSLKADQPRFLQQRTATNRWLFIQPSRSQFRYMTIEIFLFSCLLLNGFLTV